MSKQRVIPSSARAPLGRRRVTLAAASVAAVVLAALWVWMRPVEVKRDPNLSVLLITIDTLRADAVGAYGNARANTPWLDRLAAAGARFDQARAHNVVTLPSHANILSGRLPVEHGVRDNAGFRFPPESASLATLMRANGYRTGAFVSAFPLDSRFGLDRGFDVYDDRLGEADDHLGFKVQERSGVETVAAARRWLDSVADGRWFCWVHVYEPHFPYAPPQPFASRFRESPYMGEVSAADAALERLLAPLIAAGDQGRTLVIVTSDHGEGLGDHGEATHGLFAYESTLRVPLIVFAPRLFGQGAISEPVRHVDILPTVLDALGLTPPAGLQGVSLLPLASGAGQPPPAVTYFEALSTMLNRGWAPLHGVVRGGVKYIDLPIAELYDTVADPGETENRVAHEPRRTREMQALLAELRRGDRGWQRGREGADVRDRLRSLGYLTGSAAPKGRYTEQDDPKNLVALDGDLERVVSLYQSGDLRAAVALANDIAGRQPTMSAAWVQLAFLASELGDVQLSVEAARKAFDVAPDAPDVAALTGAYLTEAGHAAEAARRLEPLAMRPDADLDTVIAYGVALGSSGRAREAFSAFERATRLDPSNAIVQVDIGTLHLMEGDTARARQAFEQAIALDPTTARAYNGLGVIAAKMGRPDEAVARWREAVRLDPRAYQTLFNLGSLLRQLGRPNEARPYLEGYLREAPAAEADSTAQVRAWLAGSPVR